MSQSQSGRTVCRASWVAGHPSLHGVRSRVDLGIAPSVRSSFGRFGSTVDLAQEASNFVRNPRIGNGLGGFLKNWGTESVLGVQNSDGPLDQAHFIQVVTTVAHSSEGCFYGAGGQLAVTSGMPHTASMYVRGTGTLRARVSFDAGDGGAAGAAHTLTGLWERLAVTATPGANTIARVFLETTSAQVATIETGAWQFEASPHATAYLDGSIGDGFSWAGTPDQSASSRQAGRLSLPAAVVSAVQGGVALWWRPDHGHVFARDRILFNLPTSSDPLQVRHLTATNRFRLSSPAGDHVEVAAPAFAAGDDLLISTGWTRETIAVSVGEVVVSAERTPGGWATSGRMDLGSTGAATVALGLHADGAIGPAWWFDGPPAIETLGVIARSITLPRLVLS